MFLAYQHITMISYRWSCDTEDWSNDAKISALSSQEQYCCYWSQISTLRFGIISLLVAHNNRDQYSPVHERIATVLWTIF